MTHEKTKYFLRDFILKMGVKCSENAEVHGRPIINVNLVVKGLIWSRSGHKILGWTDNNPSMVVGWPATKKNPKNLKTKMLLHRI